MIARQLGALASECVLACQLIEPASGREVVIETLLAVLDRLERQQSELRRPALVLVGGAMTMAEIVDDVLGVERTFPRPGWVVLDAIRERRFTGEVVFETTPEVRGTPIGAGSISPSVRPIPRSAPAWSTPERSTRRSSSMGDADRRRRAPRSPVRARPSVDRQKVLVTAELMTEECVGWLARQRISDIGRALPAPRFRRPPMGSGVAPLHELAPGDPLPAPAPDAAPVAMDRPSRCSDRSTTSPTWTT